jgi:hypothetical protein
MNDLIDVKCLKSLFLLHFNIKLDGKKLARLKREGMPYYPISHKCHRFLWTECSDYILGKRKTTDIIKQAKMSAAFAYKQKAIK